MATVILVIHLILALAIIVLVLLQRSEGGGLGIGGGGGMGGLATAGQTANVLTRTTGIFAGCFFVTSLILAIMAGMNRNTGSSVLDSLDNPPAVVDSSAPVSDNDLPKVDVPAKAEKSPSGAPSAPISK
jgi:preprotein translocase subunit SecG